jgi:uncharacterized protein (TIGR03382 family)
MEVVASTREGWLYAWATGGPVGGTEGQPAIQWESFHRDDQNTGNASGRFAPLKPYAPLDPPTDGGGCGCTQQQDNPLTLAGVAILATLGLWRRRRRA